MAWLKNALSIRTSIFARRLPGYFGQFVDHDVTFDTTPLSQQNVDPYATKNFRTPCLDLDSIYAEGPSVSPHLYARDPTPPFKISNKFLIGRTEQSSDESGRAIQPLPNDLPRNQVGRALIGDERNDENLLVAQIHLAFLKFHNKVVDLVDRNKRKWSDRDKFDEVRRIVTWHYQWIVLHDWLKKLTEPGTVESILQAGRRFFQYPSRPFMPVEFSAAAYRMGHSMVREEYDHNRVFNPEQGALARATFDFMFKFTGKSGEIIGEHASSQGGGFAALPSNWVIDWRRFFEIDGQQPPHGVNKSRALDPFIAESLYSLPGEPSGRSANLAFRNLKRGVNLRLPSGQAIAAAMGIYPIRSADIATGPDGDVAAQHGLHEETPLWYYILKEAQVMHGGRHMGPVGSTIVAETVVGILQGDENSFLRRRTDWRPEIVPDDSGQFTMADLLLFTADVNPIG